MSWIFNECENLSKLDLKTFNTNNVTNMSYMFCSSYNLSELDLSTFNTSNVVN